MKWQRSKKECIKNARMAYACKFAARSPGTGMDAGKSTSIDTADVSSHREEEKTQERIKATKAKMINEEKTDNMGKAAKRKHL
jgi:hypothetical protein